MSPNCPCAQGLGRPEPAAGRTAAGRPGVRDKERPMRSLEGKVAVITGGNSGIGKATAQLFVQQGARVVVTGRRKERSEEHTSELQSLMRISYAVFCLKKKTHTLQNTSTQE